MLRRELRNRAELAEISLTCEGTGVSRWKLVGVAETFADDDVEYEALILRSRALAGWVLTLVAMLTVVGAVIPMRYLGQAWSEDDVFECQASAFVAEAAATTGAAGEAAMTECVRHRRDKRWGPWGAFGDAKDAGRYNAADD
jgi:hypothetical protein